MLKLTLLEKLNRFPPALCRLVARVGKGRGCRPLTIDEIAAISGLSPCTVYRLSKAMTWAYETGLIISAFSAGCGVDLLNTRRHREYLTRRKRWHLSKQPKYFSRLLKRMAAR
jgi:AraC-like DNA-binding protein